MSRREDEAIEFQKIPGYSGGEIWLSIYKPGTFLDVAGYSVVVGGCVVGEATNLEEAKELLEQKAKDNLASYIASAEAEAAHYRKQLAELEKTGLKERRVP